MSLCLNGIRVAVRPGGRAANFFEKLYLCMAFQEKKCYNVDTGARKVWQRSQQERAGIGYGRYR